MSSVKEVRLTWDRTSGQYRRRRNPPTPERYLRGPVPFEWLATAACLPGAALAVGIVLWHLAGLRKTRQRLSLSNERVKPFCVTRHSKDRALGALTTAGLVLVERKGGRSPRVSLV